MAKYAAMSVEDALTKYGYEASGDVWMLKRGDHFDVSKSERWLPVKGGFLCFKPARLGFGEVPFGWPVAPLSKSESATYISGQSSKGIEKDDAPVALVGLMQVPFAPSPEFEGVSGMHPAAHPEAFTWVWPEEEVAFMYQYAEEGWVRVQDYDEDGVPNGSHMERASD